MDGLLGNNQPGPDVAVEAAELQQAVWSALDQLPPEQRAVIVRRYYLDMSETEMADDLDVPHGTIKSRLRAVVALARLEPTSDSGNWAGQKVANASFDFKLPAAANTARRVVDINQTVEANGIALTLKQIRISPTTAIATVCGVDASRDKHADWVTFGTLATKPDQSDQVEKDPNDVGSTTAWQRMIFFAPHSYERGGEWTLTIMELWGNDPVLFQAQEEAFARANAEGRVLRQSPDISRTVTGPWTFTFDVPQP